MNRFTQEMWDAWEAGEEIPQPTKDIEVEGLERAFEHELAMRIVKERQREYEQARDVLSRAVSGACRARERLVEATAVLEMSCRLMTGA